MGWIAFMDWQPSQNLGWIALMDVHMGWTAIAKLGLDSPHKTWAG